MSEENGSWDLIALEVEGGKRVYRIRSQAPAGVERTDFRENVIVEWRFGEGLPDQATSAAMREFENHMDPLDDHAGNSLLVHVYTGDGIREWCYYSKDYDKFMEDLNVALADKVRYPIQILHDTDPIWKYADSIKNFANGKDEVE